MKSRWLLFLGLALLSSAPLARPATGGGTAIVTLELEGPLEEVLLDAGGHPTRITAPLARNERLTVRAPLSLPVGTRLDSRLGLGELAIEILPEGASGQARLHSVEAGSGDLVDSELSNRLTFRSRPPLGVSLARVDTPRLWLVIGTLAVVLALSRRRAWALVAGALGAGLLLFWPTPSLGAVHARVVEGDARSGEWVVVDGALDELEVLPGHLPYEDVLPGEGAEAPVPIEWLVEAGPARRERWRLVGPGHWIYAVEELESPPVIEPALNAAYPLSRAWIRAPGGEWSDHGAWELDEPLSPAGPAGDPPPGWLASGLPQGVGVLLGRIEPRADGPGESWLRVTSFDAPRAGGKAVDAPGGGR